MQEIRPIVASLVNKADYIFAASLTLLPFEQLGLVSKNPNLPSHPRVITRLDDSHASWIQLTISEILCVYRASHVS